MRKLTDIIIGIAIIAMFLKPTLLIFAVLGTALYVAWVIFSPRLIEYVKELFFEEGIESLFEEEEEEEIYSPDPGYTGDILFEIELGESNAPGIEAFIDISTIQYEDIAEYKAVSAFIEEVNARRNPSHFIDKWDMVYDRDGNWADMSRVAVYSDGNKYVAKVSYKYDSKDGGPRVTSLITRDFKLLSAGHKKLSKESKMKAIKAILEKDSLIAIHESALADIECNGSTTLKMPLYLQLSPEEWTERYKGMDSLWEEAISDWFGEGLDTAIAKRTKEAGCFEVRFA